MGIGHANGITAGSATGCMTSRNVMEELVKFTLLMRDVAPFLLDRYSERKESAAELSKTG
jgi:hypothetical protein